MNKRLMNKYASQLAKLEAGKSQVKICDIREILAIISRHPTWFLNFVIQNLFK